MLLNVITSLYKVLEFTYKWNFLSKKEELIIFIFNRFLMFKFLLQYVEISK